MTFASYEVYSLVMKTRELKRMLEAEGFELVKVRGSHYHYQKGSVRTILPFHSGEVPTGTARTILEAIEKASGESSR